MRGWTLVAATSLLALGCGKHHEELPPDAHVDEGYRLLLRSPDEALRQFQQARDPADPQALLGQGLAYEKLRDYAKAEEILSKACQAGEDPKAELALVRVQTMLGKQAEARRGIDRVVQKTPTSLPALLVQVCLANSDSRAKASLRNLDAWGKKPTGDNGVVPAEYHLARVSLLSRLREPEQARKAKAAADEAKLRHPAVGVMLATLAFRAGERRFAVLLLEHLVKNHHDRPVLQEVAVLSHQLGAHELTEQALKYLPGTDPAILRLTALHEAAMHKPSASASLRAAMAVTKQPKEVDGLRLLLAEALVREHRPKEARVELEKLIKKAPKSVPAQLQMASLERSGGDAAAAIKRLRPLASANAPPAVYESLALAYQSAGQIDDAKKAFERVLDRVPTHHLALSQLVALVMQSESQNAGIERVEKQIGSVPKDVGLRLMLANVLSHVGQQAQAEAALREAVAAMPTEVRLWAALAQRQRARQADEEVLKTLQEAERRNPESLLIAAHLAAQLTRMDRGKAALPYYERVLRFASEDALLLNNAAMLYADVVGDGEKAVDLAERAHRLAPLRPELTDTLAWALYKRGGKGDIKRARELLESVQRQNRSATGIYHMGMVMIAAGDKERGRQLLQDALALPGEFPEFDEARKALDESR